MPIPAVPLNATSRRFGPLAGPIAEAASRVASEGPCILGPGVTAFETAFADYCGAAHAVGVGNGTDALEIALKATGVGTGDRVALAANAAMYAATAVLACGAEPVFVDVLADEATLDPALLDAALAQDAPVRAVVATHLYGRLARIDAIAGSCRRHGAVLVEDCAQAHGARSADGRRAGSFGDAAAFSFYPTKNLGALGDGGAVVTGDPDLAARARSLRQYGWQDKYRSLLPGGRNSRLDELQARILHLQLPLLDGWNARRREIAARYAAGIRHPDIHVPARGGDDDVVHLLVVHSTRRDALRDHLLAAGIGCDVHYPVPDHRQPILAEAHAGTSLPVTEAQAASVLTLPCFPELTDAEASVVIDACNRF